jgi:hypothetical protein
MNCTLITRNTTIKCIHRYVNLLYYKKHSPLHVSATYCDHLQGGVLWRIYRICSRNLRFFSILAAEKSGCLKYADFFFLWRSWSGFYSSILVVPRILELLKSNWNIYGTSLYNLAHNDPKSNNPLFSRTSMSVEVRYLGFKIFFVKQVVRLLVNEQ